MSAAPLTLSSFSRALLHIDGEAFFASCEQARDPALRGKPVVTGKERGIAASLSYEAKARGVTRGMRLFEIRKLCPDAIILPSDYETYSLLSQRLFNIVRRYTPDVEEYSVDECFCDVTSLRRVLRLSYLDMARRIEQDLDTELGCPFSVGLAPTKVLAKLASKWQKPSGCTVMPGREIHQFLRQVPVGAIWGIGGNTAALLQKHGISTALDFARKDELWVKKWLTKPFDEMWQELNGRSVLPLVTAEKSTYQSIQKVKTFRPPSRDPAFVFSQLAKNVENACIKARKYRLAAHRVVLLLKTQTFRMEWVEVRLSRATASPQDIVPAIAPAFTQLFHPEEEYRATGIVLTKLEEDTRVQLDLFGEVVRAERLSKVYQAVDRMRDQYGKHTVFLGSSRLARQFAQHVGERGDAPHRQRQLFTGETKRQRVGIPMLMGKLLE